MISYLDKLNLRPAEKRLVVLAVLALFIVLNFIFVVPGFGEWGRLEQNMVDAQARLAKYAVEVNKQSFYKKELDRLRKIGQSVPTEDQSLDLATTITAQAGLSGVSVQSISADRRGSTSKTNLFFEEKTASVTLNASEQQLVDFLYLLGSGDSLIRARVMNLVPDATKMRLNATMSVVASYQKKPAAKPTGATAEGKSTSTNQLSAPVASPFRAPPTLPKTNAGVRINSGTNSIPKPK